MLSGIRIVEFEGPFAAMMLADLWAEVIVIHRPLPISPITGSESLLDRGKRSIALDLKAEDDLAIARDLIRSADALIEGFRPGVMERRGLGPGDTRALNPKLVYGRMTGWGQDGPRAMTAGHDYNYIATSGALWYSSQPGTPPIAPATLVGDIGGGALYLVAGLLAGLLRAQRSVVDAAIVDGSAHMMALLMAMAPSGKLAMERGRSILDGPHWSRSYACADGRYLAVQCLEAKFYAEFLSLLGLSDDPELAPQYDPALWPRQTRRLADLFATRPAADWMVLFGGSDACVAPVLNPQEAAADPHMAARGSWVEAHGALQPAPAPRFDGATPGVAPPPERDGDRAAIMAELDEMGRN